MNDEKYEDIGYLRGVLEMLEKKIDDSLKEQTSAIRELVQNTGDLEQRVASLEFNLQGLQKVLKLGGFALAAGLLYSAGHGGLIESVIALFGL